MSGKYFIPHHIELCAQFGKEMLIPSIKSICEQTDGEKIKEKMRIVCVYSKLVVSNRASKRSQRPRGKRGR